MRWRFLLLALGLVAACHERRAARDEAPTYAELQPLLERACARCHGGAEPAGGYAVTDYLSTTGCTADGRVATAGGAAPILEVLARADHAGLLTRDELARLRAWVEAGAPAFRGTVHEPDVIDPRSPGWHGRWVARDDFRLLRDASAPEACGRCHEGAPVAVAGFSAPAPAAPSCTSCHDEPGGVLACSTCHGAAGRPHPPRDACHFGAQPADAHQAHLASRRFTTEPLACSDCHPAPAQDLFAGAHANGTVDVQLAPQLEVEGGYDADSETCSVRCHARGGERPMPAWHEQGDVDCQSCHLSPPAAHYPGRCDGCHAEMGAEPDSLLPAGLHLDGKVDLGDGSDTCAACHGAAPTGAPRDAGHALHVGSQLMATLTCDFCHAGSGSLGAAAHMNGQLEVRFAGPALPREGQPQWDGSKQRCSDVACHGAGVLAEPEAPLWPLTGSAPVAECSSCHGAPPPPPHVQTVSCGGSLCHGNEVGLSGQRLSITPDGRSRHIDGTISIGP